jgi:hypothetical protein
MEGEAPQFACYSPTPGMARVTCLDGPLSGVEVSVPTSLPRLVTINGKRNGNHKVWITHTYRRTDDGYSHVQTVVDDIRTLC